MKYIKLFESKDCEELEIGDYVKFNEESWKDVSNWIKSGLYRNWNQDIIYFDNMFRVKDIDFSDDTYLLDKIDDWFSRRQLEKATDEEIEEFKFQQEAKKYNI